MADCLQPGELVERYEVVRRIGAGGMAEVYLVNHVTLRTVHALKVLTLSGPLLHERMEAEGRVQAQLRHPNVVHVSDVLIVGGMPALVMEFVDGPDLKRWIPETRPDPRLAEQVFRGILAGVAAAHTAGVIHRDLKPANVLLATVEGKLVAKVGDFGIVKVFRSDDEARTRTGLPMGTPQYMAPEQIRDAASVDRRADVFSLGCILYELLTWEQAYGGSDLIDIFQRIDRGQRAPLPVGVPDSLRLLIDRCLAKDPADRPPDCATVLAWLDGATIPDPPAPVVRPPPAASSPSMAWIGVLALIGGVATILLVTVAIVGLVGPGPIGLRGAGPGTCPTTGGRIGVARAPAVFEKEPGSTWTVRRETPVYAEPGAEAPVVCVLPTAARVTVASAPMFAEGERWVGIDGDQVVLGMPIVDEEDPDEVVGELCRGPAGVRIGWFHTKPVGGAPKAGKTWRPSTAKQVVADYPRKENGNRPGPPVCAIPADSEVQIVEPPVKMGFTKGYWVPVTGRD